MSKTINYFLLILLNIYSCYGWDRCGRSSVKSVPPGALIVSGTNAARGEFPWQAIVKRYFTKGGESFAEWCGGTILDQQWILTAAHCLAMGSNPDKYEVMLGYISLDNKDGNESNHKVETVIFHEGYDPDPRGPLNDIGLIKLKDMLDFNGKDNNLQPICRATETTKLTDNCIASGFGYLNKEGPQAKILQKVSEPLMDTNKCRLVFTRVNPETNVCGGGSGGSGTCQGDSGGPLQCKGTDGLWYEVGITSYGVPCAEPGYADVFTRVAGFDHWISDTIANN